MDVPQSSPPRNRQPAFLVVLAALSGSLFAQSAAPLTQNTLFLKEPGGVRLGALVAGATVAPGRISGGFREVTLRGWIFTASTQPDRREGFDLSVRPAEGENLRAAPGGAVLGRAVQGTLFERVSVRGGWTQVRRTVWISRSAMDPVARRLGGSAAMDTAARRLGGSAAVDTAARRLGGSAANGDRRASLRSRSRVHDRPEGPLVATLGEAAAQVSIGEEKGEWVEVTLRGWVRQGDLEGAVTQPPAITAAMLREAPERYLGQTADWRVQFLALQQADELRPEMPLGHHYLLARGPLPETGFVYVMLSREQAERWQGISPLDELALTVTIRAGRTRYLATPVVELVRRNP